MMALLKLPAVIKWVSRAFIAALVAAALWFAANFVQDKFEAEAEVARLEQVVMDQAEANRLLKLQAEQMKEAQEAADAARTELENLRSDYALIKRGIASAKEEDDGEVAPVLRNALDGIDALDRMR